MPTPVSVPNLVQQDADPALETCESLQGVLLQDFSGARVAGWALQRALRLSIPA